MKAIEATQKLAESENTKIFIMGNGQGQLPFVLSNPDCLRCSISFIY